MRVLGLGRQAGAVGMSREFRWWGGSGERKGEGYGCACECRCGCKCGWLAMGVLG